MGRRHHSKKHYSSSSESESECSSSDYSSGSDSDCSRSSRSSRSSSSSVSEHELHELECRFNKKLEKMYCKFLWRLRREPCLFVNGSDAHGNMYNTKVETIPIGAAIPFDNNQVLHNITHNPGDSFLTVLRDGLYYFSYNIIFDQPCQIAIFINGVLDASTVNGNNSGATVTSNTQLINLKAGDTVELRNWKSNSALTLAFAASGDQTLQTTNADFTIFKIAPNDLICSLAPEPFPKPTCEECEECPPHPPSPPKECKKDKKCRREFDKLDENKDGTISFEEYKKMCAKKKKHHKKH